MDLILRNARRVGAEDELTDIGIAGGRIARSPHRAARPRTTRRRAFPGAARSARCR